MSQDFLTNQFLVAMPTLEDPNFRESVTLICEHNSERRALGIIINRPMNVVLDDVLKQLDLTARDLATGSTSVYMGGPVQPERGFVIHAPQGEWEATLKVGDALGVTTSRDVLAALAVGNGPKRVFVALGYSGWGAGQLEEMKSNSWLSVPADAAIILRYTGGTTLAGGAPPGRGSVAALGRRRACLRDPCRQPWASTSA